MTVALLHRDKVQLPVPPQAPSQATKFHPAAGTAVDVTEFPAPKAAVHWLQLMPPGELVTVPLPTLATDSTNVGAVTVFHAITRL